MEVLIALSKEGFKVCNKPKLLSETCAIYTGKISANIIIEIGVKLVIALHHTLIKPTIL